MYTMEYYWAIKKNEILLFATTWMDLENIILSEISQTEKEILCYHLHVESKKIEWMYITKQTERYRKQTCGYQWGKERGRGKIEM